MKASGICVAFAFLVTAPVARCVAAATYTATVLNPVDFTNATGRGISIGTQGGAGDGAATGGAEHALLWSGTAASAIDLHPAGNYSSSSVWAVSGTSQAGLAETGYIHAMLWNGTAASAVDLNPAGMDLSRAYGVSNTNQVGLAVGNIVSGSSHAMMWSGTAASAIDLHPANFRDSTARGVSGGKQVGYGTTAGGAGFNHALLWSGTAASVVDLNPASYSTSFGYAISGTKQAGYGFPNSDSGNTHALLWSGTASAVDLQPSGYTQTKALGISVAGQVGYGVGTATGNRDHALVWTGTAASVVDLHSFLTGLGTTFTVSHAEAIAENGAIMGWANDTSNRHYAILWTPVPEPVSGALVAFGIAAGLLVRPRRVGR